MAYKPRTRDTNKVGWVLNCSSTIWIRVELVWLAKGPANIRLTEQKTVQKGPKRNCRKTPLELCSTNGRRTKLDSSFHEPPLPPKSTLTGGCGVPLAQCNATFIKESRTDLDINPSGGYRDATRHEEAAPLPLPFYSNGLIDPPANKAPPLSPR